MEDQANLSTQFPPNADIDDLLRRKRKTRAQRVCYPCHQRKVKCSYETPCRACIDGNHPELCSYEPSSKRVNLGSVPERPTATASPPPLVWVPSKLEWDGLSSKLDTLEQSMVELRKEIRSIVSPKRNTSSNSSHSSLQPEAPDGKRREFKGLHTNTDLTGETVYLGGNSVPAMILELGQGNGVDSVQQLFGQSILPIFALDNDTATYPFVDLWGLPHGSIVRIQQLCQVLPSDADILQYFRHYRDTVHVLYPGVVDIQEFESHLTSFLIDRGDGEILADGNDLTKQKVFGKDLHWVGLLFAVLASGLQCSGRPRRERQLTSQVYVCVAYECLRIINYLSHSTIIDIQTLLVLGDVLSNSMNAGVAWSFLGLTTRLAQSLGLNQPSPPSASSTMKSLRDNVWWQIIWQDSLLSITYDRATSTTSIDQHHQPNESEGSAKASYTDCMRSLCRIGLEIVRNRANPRGHNHELLRTIELHEQIKAIVERAADHLKYPKSCRSIKEHLEYWNLYMHKSYITADLCRRIFHRGKHNVDLLASLEKTCIESLMDTVEAFLGLQKITQFANQSWAAVHRSLSSALLLGVLGEPRRNERARILLQGLMFVMSDLSSGLDPLEVSGPIWRSLAALQKLIPWDQNTKGQTDAGTSEGDTESTTRLLVSSTPSSLFTMEDGSPYTLVDNILWGKSRTQLD